MPPVLSRGCGYSVRIVQSFALHSLRRALVSLKPHHQLLIRVHPSTKQPRKQIYRDSQIYGMVCMKTPRERDACTRGLPLVLAVSGVAALPKYSEL